MSGAKPQAPGTNAGHAGRGAIGATVVTAAAATSGHHRRTRTMAPAKRPLARRQDGRMTDRRIGVDGLHNAQQRLGRRRPARPATVGGRS